MKPTEENPVAYVDGIVSAVPTSNLETFRQYSRLFAPIFKEVGALRVVASG